MKRLTLIVLVLAGIGLLAGVPAVFVRVESPRQPDIHALDCFSHARQGQLLDPRERWTPEEALEQWRSEQDRGTVDLGCWAVSPYQCKEDCR